MSRIRVAIGEVQSALREEILVHITQQRPDMEFVGQIDKTNLKDSIARQNAEVLICEVEATELPQVCRELFSEKKAPLVVGLARGGREATICVANTGVAELTSLIRVLTSTDRHNVIEMPPRSESEPELEDQKITPYSSNSEFLNSQLRALDLALMAEVDAFESTIWDENVQRLQG